MKYDSNKENSNTTTTNNKIFDCKPSLLNPYVNGRTIK